MNAWSLESYGLTKFEFILISVIQEDCEGEKVSLEQFSGSVSLIVNGKSNLIGSK